MARPILAAVVALLAVVYSQQAYAFGGMMDMHGGHMRDMAMMAGPHMGGSCPTPDFLLDNRDDLGLSEAQQSDLRKLDFELRRQKLLKGAAVKALELELTEIVTDPSFDVDTALDKLSEIEKARTELRSAVIKSSAKARDVLDAGQKETLKELLTGVMPEEQAEPEEGKKPSPDTDKGAIREQMMRKMMKENMPQE